MSLVRVETLIEAPTLIELVSLHNKVRAFTGEAIEFKTFQDVKTFQWYSSFYIQPNLMEGLKFYLENKETNK